MKKKILLIAYRLGYENLLYWDSILTNIKKEYPEFRVFTSFSAKTNDNSMQVEDKLKGLKFYTRKRKVSPKLNYVPLPFFIFDIFKFKPNLIILNEFNLACFFTLFFSFIYKNTSFLLLVESDPFLGYENKHSWFRNFIRKYIARRSDRILTNNQLGHDYLVNELKVLSSKIEVRPYLVSKPPKFLVKSDNIFKNNKIQILYVGQLIKRKGIINVLKALTKLNDTENNKIQFDIIGKGDELSTLKCFARENKLLNVNFLGHLPYKKLSKYYENADLFILSTLHDYRALVGFEALASGCAIIGSKYDGARFEIVHEGKNGFIVDPKNYKTFVRPLKLLVNDSVLLNSYKQYSATISNKFSTANGIKNFLKVIERI